MPKCSLKSAAPKIKLIQSSWLQGIMNNHPTATESDDKIISMWTRKGQIECFFVYIDGSRYRSRGGKGEYYIPSHSYLYLLPNVNAIEYYHLIYPPRGDGGIFVKFPKCPYYAEGHFISVNCPMLAIWIG